jgi:ribonuclease R
VVSPINKPKVDALLEEFGLSPDFPDEVCQEAGAFSKNPGFEDSGLRDRRDLEFITIDNADSRDLDQALYIDDRAAGGWVLYYALADTSHYVPRGSATFAEALRRGASYYLPGFVVPMLPRALSEGLVSLNPRVDRRALLFVVEVGADGEVVSTNVERALIHSRAKLTYHGVQAFLDEPSTSPISGSRYEASLLALRRFGLARIRRAEQGGVVHFHRVGVTISDTEAGWEAGPDLRVEVERYNEQVSLLCNSEGARLLGRDLDRHPYVEPIYKVHPAPEARDLRDLAAEILKIVSAHRLTSSAWSWDRERQTLAEYVRGLPRTEEPRVARVIERQCMIAGAASRFSAKKGCHYGVGVDAYGRFTAPMREVVGVFTHWEMVERIEGAGVVDDALRVEVVRAGNRARDTQRRVTKAVYRQVLDRMFGDDLDAARPVVRTGTVMGKRGGRVYVQLDDPPIEVKVYTDDTGPFGLGDLIQLRTTGLSGDRWRLVPVSLPRSA